MSKVSVYYNTRSHKPAGEREMDDILFSDKYRTEIEELRRIGKGSKEFVELKHALPCWTPSGTFTYGRDSDLKEHSGFVCLDFDNVADVGDLKQQLSGLGFVYYAGLSCSGTGVFALVKIANPTLHRAYCTALENFFTEWGQPIDPSCKNLSRLRIASLDEHPFYNPNSVTWSMAKEAYLPSSVSPTHCIYDTYENKPVSRACDYIISHGIDITQGRSNWLAIGTFIHSTYGASGKGIFRGLSQFHPKFNEADFESAWSAATRMRSYGVGVFANACRQAGVPDLKSIAKMQHI